MRIGALKAGRPEHGRSLGRRAQDALVGPAHRLLAYLRRTATELREENVSLAPYRRQRSPKRAMFRRRGILTLIALVGAAYGFLVSIFPIGWYLYMALPMALLLLLIIWALPDSATYPARSIEWLLFAVFVSTFIWPNYLAIALPGLPWITMVRLWSLPLFLLTLVSLSTSKAFRTDIAEPFRTSPWLLRFMVAVVIVQTLTLPMSKHFADSVNKFLDAQFQWTTMFFASAFIFLKAGRARTWMLLLCLIAVFLCLLSLAELENGAPLWTGHIPSFLAVPDESVQRILVGGRRSALGIYRIQSTFSTSLNFAEFLGLTTPFFLYFLITTRKALIKLLIIAYLPFSFWVIRGTDSRLGVVAFFSSILIYILLWSLKNWLLRRRDMVAPLFVLTYPALAGTFFALTFIWQRLGRMVWGGGAQAASTEGRKEQYAEAIPKIVAWPFGNGIGEGATTLGKVSRSGVLTIDSYYIVIALEYGLLGFIAYYGLVFAGIWQAVKHGLKSTDPEAALLLPLAVMLSVFVIAKGVLAQDDNHVLVFITLGMVAALAHKVNLSLAALPSSRADLSPSRI